MPAAHRQDSPRPSVLARPTAGKFRTLAACLFALWISTPTLWGQSISLSVDAPELHSALGHKPAPKLARIDASERGPGVLEVRPVSAFGADAKILLHTEDGIQRLEIPEAVRYLGRVVGVPGSKVMLTVLPTGIRGLVWSGTDVWVVGQGTAAKASSFTLQMRKIDLETELAEKSSGFRCQELVIDEPADLLDVVQQTFATAGAKLDLPDLFLRTARLVIETDNEYFAAFGGDAAAAANYAADLIAYSSFSFEDEIDTNLVIVELNLWSTFDPWSMSDEGCQLNQLSRYWYNNGASVDRTMVHLLTPRFSGGVAWRDTLCAEGIEVDISGEGCALSPDIDRYGGAYALTGALALDFDYDDPSIVWDIFASTHEMGHVFGSPHSHCYAGVGGQAFPVDGCYNGECGGSGCFCQSTDLPLYCPGSGNGCGTLMSYCHLRSGGISNIALSFGTDFPYGIEPERIAERMNSRAATKAANYPGCLDPVCPGGTDPTDTDGDGYPDECDQCDGDDATDDSDVDGVCDDLDTCPGFDDGDDTDGDSVPDGCDICSGYDDSADDDGDSVPDGCDDCAGFDDADDSDGDDVPDGCDVCPGGDDAEDADSDYVPDDCDVCPGFDDAEDADFDDVPDGCDICAGGDDAEDADFDGVPDTCDVCAGADDTVDSDGDGVPDGCDLCAGADDTVDSDGDTMPDGCDVCPGMDDTMVDPTDSDSDGIPDRCDVCEGFDDTIDGDGDDVPDGCDVCPGGDDAIDFDGDMVCAHLDCDDADPDAQETDRCGVCGGDGTSCLVLFAIGDEFVVASTTGSDQSAPSIAAGDDGFLVTWTSGDVDGTGIRGRLFGSDGTPVGDDFSLNETTSGSQDRSAVTALSGAGFVTAWHAESVDGDGTGIAGRLVDGAPSGSELQLNSVAANSQLLPKLAPTSDGFQAVWQTTGLDGDGSQGVALRRFLADGTPTGSDAALTGDAEQSLPDVAALPTGALVSWIDASTGARVLRLDADGIPSGSDVGARTNAEAAALAADASGNAQIAMTDPVADATGGGSIWKGSVFARPFGADGQTAGGAKRVSPRAWYEQFEPDVAALPDGGFLVVYEDEDEDENTSQVRAQLFESDGNFAVTGIPGALVQADPFVVNQGVSAVAETPAVAGDSHGTFFVVWKDSAIDGSGTGIAGRLFGTDTDADDLPGVLDNCPTDANADQADADSDDVGDVCDACPGSDDRTDADGDVTADGCDTCTDTDDDEYGDPGYPANTCATDNCPDEPNADQADADLDGTGDVCDTCTDSDDDGAGDPGFPANTCATDNCPEEPNADQADVDEDGTGDVCDTCTDSDDDGAGDPGFPANTCATDNCPDESNADQADADLDGTGDVCDTCTDSDDDGAGDPGFPANTCATDNCPDEPNADQADADVDGTGDVCDTCTDSDSDGMGDPGFPANTCATDNCPDEPNADQADADLDGTGDVCDTCSDTDGDGAGDPGFPANTCATDNCPDEPNADQADADLDGTGDVCDTCTDSDSDGMGDPGFPANTCATDNCPDDSNVDQADADEDETGDVCDTCSDIDGDGAGDPGFPANTCATDNCPALPNPDQADADLDGVGDVCDMCLGNDATGDSDADGVCDDSDLCAGSDDGLDADSDGVPDGCDVCQGDDAEGDTDGDGVCDDIDACQGDDATGDADGDEICGNLDCDDDDPTNACGPIFGDGFESGDTSGWSSVVN